MPTPSGPTIPGFWKCLKCGTPNPGTIYLTACIGCGFPRPAPGFEAMDSRPSTPDASPRRVGFPRGLLVAVASYGLVLIAAFLLGSVIGDSWWPGFALQMGPRAAFLVPLVPLGVWAWWARRPAIGGAVLLEALFVAGPMMGFVVPWARLSARAEGPRVRIMTFNRGGKQGFDTADFLRYIDRQKIDVVCFQEFADDPMLDRVLAERSWHRDRSKAIASRFPIVEDYPRSVERNETDRRYNGLLYRVRLRGPDGREFVVGCLHMPTARHALTKLFRLDPGSMTPFIDWWNSELTRMFELLTDLGDLPVLVGGDFNNGPDATRLAEFRDSGVFQSAFDSAGFGWGYTKPSSFPWVRIDHILASPSWAVTSCWIGPSFGSDHKSMIAEVALPAKP